METFTANQAKQQFGQVMDSARIHAVSITKYNKPALVVTSYEEYQELLELKHEKLSREVRKGFDQLDKGKVSKRSADEIAQAALQRYQNK